MRVIILALQIFSLLAWEKTQYPQFQNLSDAEFARRYLTLQMEDLSLKFPRKNYTLFKSVLHPLPVSFDSRFIWPSCIHPVVNQYFCGSCYAVSAATVLSDRFCIATKSAINLDLSPQYIISCNPWTDGCMGGGLYSTWFFLEYYGIPTSGCVPYLSWQGDEYPCDFIECMDETPPLAYFARIGSTHLFANKDDMKLDIMNNGPIQAGFVIYGDFRDYKSGVYVPENKTIIGAHAAKVVGWGVEEGVEYWTLSNSWGDDWGEEGYFRIKHDEALLENNAIAGLPDVFSGRVGKIQDPMNMK